MRVLLVALACLAIAAPAAPASADDASTRHLLAGVRAFKQARYEEALVELRVVARSPDAPADLAFYLGPTLYKLGRYPEAIGVFLASRAERDDLSDFYLGQAYYQLRLYRSARAVFVALRGKGLGPALDEAASRYVAAVDAAFVKAPSADTTDIYLAQAREMMMSEPLVAAAVLDEARQIDALAAPPHRTAELAEATWQLARAYVAAGDAAHARPLLEEIVKSGTHAPEAAALLGTLPR